jgi:hypothetical protein
MCDKILDWAEYRNMNATRVVSAAQTSGANARVDGTTEGFAQLLPTRELRSNRGRGARCVWLMVVVELVKS